ncbi:uncharacterized protein LOC143735221 isoform X2 [Siphateles boraxobius]|uniref:uncharacterized protein LOC143735221 isoform X2 n=1 Tax=Siphateles boraxobius TaxID=180520 RepID=UPI0040642515
MEGDSVTLNTDVTVIHENDDIMWKFGDENTCIAKIKKKQIFSTCNDSDGRFRDRLKLDDQTGSLIITNIRTEHTGVYQLEIIGAELTSKTFSVSVYARLPVPVIISNSSQCSSSSSCSLVCSSVLNVSDATLSWYAGMSVLSSISVCDLSISLSLPLEVEYQDKNTYSCVLNNPISNQTTHLDINTLCHTCAVSVSLIVLISAGSLMIVAGFWILWICRKCRKTDKEVETREEEIIYAEATFYKRNAQKESNMEYRWYLGSSSGSFLSIFAQCSTIIGSVTLSGRHGPPSATVGFHPGWTSGFSLAPPTICTTVVSYVITSPGILSSTSASSLLGTVSANSHLSGKGRTVTVMFRLSLFAVFVSMVTHLITLFVQLFPH